MPIFEYRCQQCGADFERLVRSGNDKVKCPECAGRRVRRKPSVFAMSGSSEDGSRRLVPSSCASCHATSCAECHK